LSELIFTNILNLKALLYFYLKGDSLITAYWKSVKWPNEGLFIGEPLASPYAN